MRARARVNNTTGVLGGITIVSVDHDIEHVQPTETYDVVDVPVNHPALQEQLAWTAPKREVFGALWDRQLTRKPQDQIDVEEAERDARLHPPRAPRDTDLLLLLVNELRAKNGDGPVTLEDLRSANDRAADVVLPRSPV